LLAVLRAVRNPATACKTAKSLAPDAVVSAAARHTSKGLQGLVGHRRLVAIDLDVANADLLAIGLQLGF